MPFLQRHRIANLPTPVETLSRLSDALRGPRLLVKRDDLTGLAFGGNKTRKLEFLVADALEQGAQTLVTAGAVQSNHCRQTAAAAARCGLACALVLTGRPPDHVSGNLLLDQLLGADVIFAPDVDRAQALEETFQNYQKRGRKPYLIPYGGSNPLGAAAYAHALHELLDQGANPDWIVFPSSSGGTQAGLVAGARMSGFTGRVLGISVDEPARALQERVARLAAKVSHLLGADQSFGPDDILVNADYLGGGYGVMGAAEREAIQLFARHEGLLLDPVYTGRAAAGMIDLIRRGFFSRDQTVLFWHTGGTPALFAEQYQGLVESPPTAEG